MAINSTVTSKRDLKLRASIAAALATRHLTTPGLVAATGATALQVRRELWEMLSHHEIATRAGNTWSLLAIPIFITTTAGAR